NGARSLPETKVAGQRPGPTERRGYGRRGESLSSRPIFVWLAYLTWADLQSASCLVVPITNRPHDTSSLRVDAVLAQLLPQRLAMDAQPPRRPPPPPARLRQRPSDGPLLQFLEVQARRAVRLRLRQRVTGQVQVARVDDVAAHRHGALQHRTQLPHVARPRE